jgi:hypothetical protein
MTPAQKRIIRLIVQVFETGTASARAYGTRPEPCNGVKAGVRWGDDGGWRRCVRRRCRRPI